MHFTRAESSTDNPTYCQLVTVELSPVAHIRRGFAGATRPLVLETRAADDVPLSGEALDVPLSSATVQKACKLGAALARINKPVTPHTLRHS